MDNRELAVECMKIAASVTSVSVHDRVSVVADSTNMLYKSIIELVDGEIKSADASSADTPRKPGRPRKPRAETE